jgi:hypothetical protein
MDVAWLESVLGPFCAGPSVPVQAVLCDDMQNRAVIVLARVQFRGARRMPLLRRRIVGVAVATALIAVGCGGRGSGGSAGPTGSQSPAVVLNKAVERGDAAIAASQAKVLAAGVRTALDALTAALASGHVQIRESAARALLGCYPHLALTKKSLLSLLDAPGDGGPTDGSLLLVRAGPAAFPLLQDAMHSSSATVRARAAWAAGTIQPANLDAVDDLVALLQDTSVDVRARAAYAIEGMVGEHRGDPSIQAAVPGVARALDDAEPRVRASAVNTLGLLGPAATSCLARIIEISQADSAPAVRRNAVAAMVEIAPGSEDVKSALDKARQDPDTGVRAAATKALEAVGR